MQVVPKGSYPPGLKNILKCGPSLVVGGIFGMAFCTFLHGVIHHPKERVEKFYFRSSKFQRLLRKRDDKLRYFKEEAVEFQPNEQRLINTRPMFRY